MEKENVLLSDIDVVDIQLAENQPIAESDEENEQSPTSEEKRGKGWRLMV